MITIRLIDARRGLSCKCRELFGNEKIADEIYRYLCDGLEECENVEPERKKGKWVRLTRDLAKCSVCEDYIDNAISCGYNYCPNCGAELSI